MVECLSMRRLPLAGLIVVVAVLGAFVLFGSRPHRHELIVGGVEDAAKWADPGGNMALAASAGFRVIVLSSVWSRGQRAPSAIDLGSLRQAIDSGEADEIQPIVAVYFFAGDTPLTARQRADFAAYAASIPKAIPELRYLSLGNEPNSNVFWMPQFGPGGSDAAAAGYFRVLATAYAAVKRADPGVTVLGGSLSSHGSDRPNRGYPSHSPTQFIEDLGKAFRSSGLKRPPLDLFSIHPYPANSSIPPTHRDTHSTSIGIADYPRLVRLLRGAFGKPPPIVYGEYGIETEIPRAETGLYSGIRPKSIRAVTELRQGDDYIEAIHLAACQPLVRMLIFFHVTDETQLTGLQTGLFYPNGKPKASLGPVSASAQAAEKGQVKCGR
jgi:hypothetical protein